MIKNSKLGRMQPYTRASDIDMEMEGEKMSPCFIS